MRRYGSTDMRTRLTTLLLAAAVILWTVGGCARQEHREPSPGHRAPCPHASRHELGFVRSADGPWPSFRSAGGEVYVGVRGLEQDTVLGEVRLTRMSLVDLDHKPRFRPGTSVVRNVSVTADLRPGRLTKVEVPAGSYRVVSSNGGNLWLESCADGLLSDVRVAHRASDAG